MSIKFFGKTIIALLIGNSVQNGFADPTYENYVLALANGVAKNPATRLFDDRTIKLQLEVIRTENINAVPVSQRMGAFYAYTNFGSGDIYYTYNNTAILINSFNLTTKQYLGGWKIESYNQTTTMVGEIPQASQDSASLRGDDLEPFTDPTAPETGYAVYLESGIMRNANGCLAKYPLRYGDLDLDSKKELVLIIGGDFVVFSTDLKKVIFGANMLHADEITDPQRTQELRNIHGTNSTTPQFIAYSGTQIGIDKIYPAERAFAKLFFGDFNNDNVFDIVVWRKLFESRLLTDPVQGFNKVGDLFVHYQVVNGEYKKQPTDQATAKSWLTTNNQTWKKGYPNTSECANQTNQLIPEMHDALLNDPDVLQ